MEISEYQKLAMKTLNPEIKKEEIIINAVMGLSAESGEATDLVKKYLFQGHELNKEEMIKELGDIAWYLAEAAYALDVDLNDVFEENIRKLKARFPEGFDAKRSIHRDHFKGYEAADRKVNNNDYPMIKDIWDLYEIVKKAWCYETCAPRMAKDWSEDHPALGQCSVTSFLVQDILGGEVYGIKLKDGSFHCFNVLDGQIYDLSSLQFAKELDYRDICLQERAVHFAKEEKYQRYLLLKQRFEKICKEKDTD